MRVKEFKIIFVGDVELELENSNIQINKKNSEIIEKIWNDELTKNPQLKNNKVLSLVNHKIMKNKCIVKARFIEFKNALADRNHTELDLGISVLGVSGIIILKNSQDTVIFARRNKNSTEYPDHLELIPSGHLDQSCKIDGDIAFKEHLLVEFEEETRISKKIVNKISTLGLIKDFINNVYDICCILEINQEDFDINVLKHLSNEYCNHN